MFISGKCFYELSIITNTIKYDSNDFLNLIFAIFSKEKIVELL